MSLDATKWATSRAPRSKGAARALLLILADMANQHERHTCRPTIERLAARLNCSTRTVKRHIAALEEVGDIVVRLGGGRGNSNIYAFPALSGIANSDRIVTVCDAEKVTNLARKGDSFGAEKVTNLARKGDKPVPPINQPLNNNLNTSNREQSSSAAHGDDDDDLAAPYRAELAQIVNRALTAGERGIIAATCSDADGRRRMGIALDRLRARWPQIARRDDVAGWLQTTLANLVGEEPTADRGRRNAPDEPRDYTTPETLDEMRLEHAIDPDPLPPYSQLWRETMEALRLELPTGTLHAWLEGAEAIAGSDNALHVQLRNGAVVSQRLHRVCERTLRSVAGRYVALEFVDHAGD